MWRTRTGVVSVVAVLCALLVAVPAGAQLRPELVEEQRQLDQALGQIGVEIWDPYELFAIPPTARVVHLVADWEGFSTDGKNALLQWLDQPGHVLWVNIPRSARLFGATVLPGYQAPEPVGVLVEPDSHPLVEGVTWVDPAGGALQSVPEGALRLIGDTYATLCAVWPCGQGTVIFVPTLASVQTRPGGATGGPPIYGGGGGLGGGGRPMEGLTPGRFDNDRFVLNLKKWTLELTEGAAAPTPAEAVAPEVPEVAPDAEGCVTCPHCGQRMRVAPAAVAAGEETPEAGVAAQAQPAATPAAGPRPRPLGPGPDRAAWGME